jgi:hypothetical protein
MNGKIGTNFLVKMNHLSQISFHQYITWAIKIKEFMTKARGGGTKKSQLCRFVRLYIERI